LQERLAAVVALQKLPDRHYLRWLSERAATEEPFLVYHAGVALLKSAQGLPDDDLDAVETAVRDEQEWTKHLEETSPKRRVLQDARDEVIRRTTQP
jgi:hypothetical protein